MALDERGVAREADERDRARVRDVGQQRAERDGELHAERLGELDDAVAERAPAHRRLGARDEHEVARRARRVRGPDLDLGPLDGARDAVDEPDRRARGLEVEELLGIQAREARRAELGADERQRRRGGLAGVVPAAERAHERGGPEAVRTALPDQWRHPGHGTSWARASGRRSPRPRRPPDAARPGAIATLRDGDALDGVYACTRKDRLMARTGSPYLARRAARPHRRAPGRLFRDADLHAARFERGDLVRAAGRVARFRGELQAELTSLVARRTRARPTRPRSCPTAYRDLDELDGFLDALAGEVRQPGFRALLVRLLGDEELRARAAPLARRRARSTTPTSAGCSSTPSPSRRSPSRRACCTSAWTRTCCSRPRSCTTWAASAS